MDSELSGTGLSGRYGLALFELVQESGQGEAISQNITDLLTLLGDNADLQKLIRNPLISKEEQSDAFAALLKEMQADPLLQSFIQFLIIKRRIFLLPQALRDYEALAAETRNEITAYVTSAAPLAEAQTQTLTKTLAQTLGKSVRLQAQTDPSLLGGFVLKVGSRMIDGSLSHQLQSLQAKMNEAS